jgi:hypothetical protein
MTGKKEEQCSYPVPVHTIESIILTLRGQKVVLDADLARIYGVATKVLNQAVKRNADRFPPDFLFALTDAEKTEVVTNCDHLAKLKFSRVAPYAFTEHGAIMAATVLNSPRAVQMSVFVVRAFIKMREQLLNRIEMEKRLAEIEQGLMSHDAALRDLYAKIRPLLLAPPDPPKKPIGFSVRESRARYQVRMRKGE